MNFVSSPSQSVYAITRTLSIAHPSKSLISWIALAAILLATIGVAQRSVAQNFTTTGPMLTDRLNGDTATLLQNGQVLITGGQATTCTTCPDVLSEAELYNPATGKFTATGSMTTKRENHSATLLPNGQVLIVGGDSGCAGIGCEYSSAELYDPNTGTFTATGSMTTARTLPSATLLSNGQVLIVGGAGSTNTHTFAPLASAELYNPFTGTFTAGGAMTTARVSHTATLLPNGEVLIAGGTANPPTPLANAELFDAKTGSFSATGSMANARYFHTATLLCTGQVLIAGGLGNSGPLSAGELYSPNKGSFSDTGSLNYSRDSHAATLLGNGKVLITGGTGPVTVSSLFNPGYIAEIYDPAKHIFRTTAAMVNARVNHTATLLPNGEILLAGGNNPDFAFAADAELFNPKSKSCVPGSVACGWHGGDLITFSQYGWSQSMIGSGLLNSDFCFVYFSSNCILIVGVAGDPNEYQMLFDSASALIAYLPQSGTAAALISDLLDPTTSSSGVFGGDVAALKLNVDFADAGITLGKSQLPVGNLTLCNFTDLTALNGMTVRQFLVTVNTLLGGGSGPYSISDLDPITADLGSSFGNDGDVSAFAQQHLSSGACP